MGEYRRLEMAIFLRTFNHDSIGGSVHALPLSLYLPAPLELSPISPPLQQDQREIATYTPPYRPSLLLSGNYFLICGQIFKEITAQ
jgi:hypothetical protein